MLFRSLILAILIMIPFSSFGEEPRKVQEIHIDVTLDSVISIEINENLGLIMDLPKGTKVVLTGKKQ